MLFKMHPPVILCTAAFFILSLLCSPASPQQPAGDQSNSKLIKLAIYWPTSLCNGKTKCKYNTPPDRFSIHGPWPLYRDPPGPDTIDWDTFPNDTEEKMKVDWASYGTTTNREFWNHEWKDHGRISGLLPPAYFNLGLDLFYRVGLGNHLRAEGMYPAGQTVDNKVFSTAVSKVADGKRLILLCNKDRAGVVQLYEIDICVDHATAAHDYADCPQPTPGLKSLCPDSFRLTEATVTVQFTGSDSPVHDEF
ncbi:intracellular ribonuclease LX-like [Malania oleifera]|uniref:intracellular ribonuclease LX-like n=1 Tax=Malania oleifera TaxID=397392 RepID=UPI0025AE0899|nr:intracellular ribonuclease LX-like [Malania oleifera]